MKLVTLALAATVALSPVMSSAASLIALYQFENEDGTDTSGNSNTATELTGVTYTASQAGFGKAAEFSAVSGLSGFDTGIDINKSALPTLTMGAWVYTDGVGAILSHDNGSFDRTLKFDNRGNSPGTNLAAFNGSGVSDVSGAFALQNQWIHVAVVYNGANSEIYVNGVASRGFTDNTANNASAFDLHIGTNPGFNEDFVGLMDDVFVYDGALSATQIDNIYKNGIAPVPLPTSLPLLAAGLVAVGLAGRARR